MKKIKAKDLRPGMKLYGVREDGQMQRYPDGPRVLGTVTPLRPGWVTITSTDGEDAPVRAELEFFV